MMNRPTERSIVRGGCALLLVLTVAACSKRSSTITLGESQLLGEIRCIALSPLQDQRTQKSEYQHAAGSMSSWLQHELLTDRTFNLVGSEEIEALLNKHG